MTEKRKSDKIELDKRIRIVQEWILLDHSTTDIINQCIANWDVTPRQAYRYLWAANKFFEEKNKLSLERKRAYYLAKRKKLLRDMNPIERKSAAGVAAASRVITAMEKLDGVNENTLKLIGDPDRPIKTESDVNFKSPIDYGKMSTDFLDMIIANRKSKHV